MRAISVLSSTSAAVPIFVSSTSNQNRDSSTSSVVRT
eukprot:CAMPEP_0202913538 /NCGR_PEP_ID=MMETSP1392-20130828/60748_1 /ASSEMBLY_ACC=CAM_ASM_000868 /TAXON_ID=225041 /ORGANISM="Chlamydomonas chlamydogama, Strain SAG 11-48b" /LENGTH=36 /DNA_ID= /DNA_START= /DNA_END= /DNA_ORIENTATION=